MEINVPAHIEALARTTAHYETAALDSWGSDKSAFVPARCLVLGHANKLPMLPWTLLLRLGVDPSTESADSLESKTHILEMAAAFPGRDELGIRLVQRHEAQTTVAQNEKRKRFSILSSYTPPSPDVPLPAPPPWMPAVENNTYERKFVRSHAAWYSDHALGQIFTQSSPHIAYMLPVACAALKAAGRDVGVLQTAASKTLRYMTASGRGYNATRYGDQAVCAKHCAPGAAEAVVMELKGRAAACIGVALPNPTEELMVQGLRALCAMSSPDEVLPLMSRAPTLAELRACRIKGLLYLLWRMPWELISPLIKSDLSGVRALLLKEGTDDLARAQEALRDHPKRLQRRAEVTPVADDTSWKEFSTALRTQYFGACALRKTLGALSPDVATVLVMDRLAPLEHLAPVRELRNNRAIEAALIAWPRAVERRDGYLYEIG